MGEGALMFSWTPGPASPWRLEQFEAIPLRLPSIAEGERKYRACKRCNVLYQPTAGHQVYCSVDCRWRAQREEAPRDASEARRCICCGAEFVAAQRNYTLCSKACRIKHKREETRRRDAKRRADTRRDIDGHPKRDDAATGLSGHTAGHHPRASELLPAAPVLAEAAG